jgi:hypothetical protein
MRTESARAQPWELCAACYEFPRQKGNPLCRRCVSLQRAAEEADEREQRIGDRAHLKRLIATGRDYAGP